MPVFFPSFQPWRGEERRGDRRIGRKAKMLFHLTKHAKAAPVHATPCPTVTSSMQKCQMVLSFSSREVGEMVEHRDQRMAPVSQCQKCVCVCKKVKMQKEEKEKGERNKEEKGEEERRQNLEKKMQRQKVLI